MGSEQLLLFVEQDGDDDADDEDHGQDGPDDPDQPLLTIDDGLWVRVVQLDGVGEGAGSIGLEDREHGGTRLRAGMGTEKWASTRYSTGGAAGEDVSSLQHNPNGNRENALFNIEKIPLALSIHVRASSTSSAPGRQTTERSHSCEAVACPVPVAHPLSWPGRCF